MKKIFKYLLSLNEIQKIEMPKDAKILCVQAQRNELCLWALTDPDNSLETRQIRVFGTGHETSGIDLDYIGTVKMIDDNLIWHVFEELEV